MIRADQEGQFEKIFHIPEPWYIDRIEFSEEEAQLNVYVKFRKRAVFPCSDCGALNQPVKDIATYDRTWRHLNFMEYPCYIHAELPLNEVRSMRSCDACECALGTGEAKALFHALL